ncbi:MAG: DUF3617 family protein [Pseudomonadota bacterium]
MPRTLTASAASFVLIGAAAAQDTIRVEPGLWSYENTMSGTATMPGSPPFNLPPTTSNDTDCITPDETEITPERMIREMREDGGGECEYDDITFSGNTMSTNMTCVADGMNMSGDYTFEVSDDGRAGTGTLDLNGVAEGMTITSTFILRGRWVEPCN